LVFSKIRRTNYHTVSHEIKSTGPDWLPDWGTEYLRVTHDTAKDFKGLYRLYMGIEQKRSGSDFEREVDAFPPPNISGPVTNDSIYYTENRILI